MDLIIEISYQGLPAKRKLKGLLLPQEMMQELEKPLHFIKEGDLCSPSLNDYFKDFESVIGEICFESFFLV